MNIFKILSSGHGNVGETNVSAFLGYILNPKADHGLNAEFLRAFLQPLIKEGLDNGWAISKELWIKDDEYVRDLSSVSPYDVEVFYEKSFKTTQTGKGNIVDIIIKISRKPEDAQKGDLIFKNNTPVALILVENKIRKEASHSKKKNENKTEAEEELKEVTENDENENEKHQIIDQYMATFKFLENFSDPSNKVFLNNIYTIFVTTGHDIFVKEWNNFNADKNLKGIHILWENKQNDEDDDENENHESDESKRLEQTSVDNMLKDIISKEASCEIEPLQDYTKQTLKAFYNFIKYDFRSSIEEVKNPRTFFYNSAVILNELENDKPNIYLLYKRLYDIIIKNFPEIFLKRTTFAKYNRINFTFKKGKDLALQVIFMGDRLRLQIHRRHIPEENNLLENGWELSDRGNHIVWLKVISSVDEVNLQEQNITKAIQLVKNNDS